MSTSVDPSTTRAASTDPASTLPPHLRPHLHADDTVAPVLLTDFDVARYTRAAPGRLEVDQEALAADAGGLDDPQLRRDLAFLQRIQSSALAEARAMLSTWTVNESRITAFLATWLFERHWASHAISGLLSATGEVPQDPAPSRHPVARLRALHAAHILPVIGPVWTGTVGEPVTAGHMARMSIQEASLAAAHRALLERTHGEARRILSTVLERGSEARDFFRLEATARITRSRAEAVCARIMLAAAGPAWRTVGVADAEERLALRSILRDPVARAEVRRAHDDLSRHLPGPSLPVPLP